LLSTSARQREDSLPSKQGRERGVLAIDARERERGELAVNVHKREMIVGHRSACERERRVCQFCKGQ